MLPKNLENNIFNLLLLSGVYFHSLRLKLNISRIILHQVCFKEFVWWIFLCCLRLISRVFPRWQKRKQVLNRMNTQQLLIERSVGLSMDFLKTMTWKASALHEVRTTNWPLFSSPSFVRFFFFFLFSRFMSYCWVSACEEEKVIAKYLHWGSL